MAKIPNPHFGAIPNIPKPQVSGGIGSVSVGHNAPAENKPVGENIPKRVITITSTKTNPSPIQEAYAAAVKDKDKILKETLKATRVAFNKKSASKKKK